jgi:hypothetical protein
VRWRASVEAAFRHLEVKRLPTAEETVTMTGMDQKMARMDTDTSQMVS